jgi:hypothetical protein
MVALSKIGTVFSQESSWVFFTNQDEEDLYRYFVPLRKYLGTKWQVTFWPFENTIHKQLRDEYSILSVIKKITAKIIEAEAGIQYADKANIRDMEHRRTLEW